MKLDGKVGIITGAANGIGLATAEAFVASGARVLLVDVHEAALQAVVTRLGPDATAYSVLDVSHDDSAQTYTAEALRRFGRIDIAVLNAGIEGAVAPIGASPLDMFDRLMAVNVRGVWLGLTALMPAMHAHGGSIVITSSTAGLKGAPNMAPYSTSKHAVVGLMRSAALEGASHRIRVNTVHPGPIETRMMVSIETGRNPANRDAARTAVTSRIPLKRYGKASEIADMMVFLASDEAQFCTATTFVVDGGLLAT